MKFLEFDETRDFPFYNNNPRISKIGWIILLLSVPVAFLSYSVSAFIIESDIISGIIFCLIMLIPLLYFSKWDYKLMFRKPTRNEIILALLLFLGYIIYSICINYVLTEVGLAGIDTTAESMGINIESIIALLFSMMAEELLKFIPLMFLMRVVYKFTSNRKLAIAVSAVIVMIGFGLIHYNPPYLTLASVLLLQGFGTIFEMYGYLKTKNIFVPYLSHLLTDAFVFTIMIIGVA